jgi:hypothetical protein
MDQLEVIKDRMGKWGARAIGSMDINWLIDEIVRLREALRIMEEKSGNRQD